MSNRYSLRNIFICSIVLLPFIYLAYNYAALPSIVPTHFGLEGKADGFSNKKTLWLFLSFLSALSIGVYFLIINRSKIDPKKTAKLSVSAFQKIAVGIVIFISALNILIVYASISGGIALNKLLLPATGLFFIYLGNLIHSIKPNYFVGIKTPWALEDPANWRATHHLGGKMWVAGGILITISTLLLPQKAGGIIFSIIASLLVVIPFAYSYLYFKKHK